MNTETFTASAGDLIGTAERGCFPETRTQVTDRQGKGCVADGEQKRLIIPLGTSMA